MMLKKGMRVAKVIAILGDKENTPEISIRTGLVVESAGKTRAEMHGNRFPSDAAHTFLPWAQVGSVITYVPDTAEDIAKATEAARRWLSDRRQAIFDDLVKRHAMFSMEAEPTITQR